MLILASASPRRHELLKAAQIEHVVRPSNIPEQRLPNELPEELVQRLAQEKARSICGEPEDVILGADTVVCVEGEVLGKPCNLEEAAQMLQKLSGRDHRVLTGICLRHGSRTIVDLAVTRVWFRSLENQELSSYLATRESMDKAGGYAIQGYASRFVERIEGCYNNIVGLPVSLVYLYLKSLCGES